MKNAPQIVAERVEPKLPAVQLVPLPCWGNADTIKTFFGIAPKQLADLVEAGEIRKRKMGHTQQATALYRCYDVLEFMESGRPYPQEEL